VHKSLEQSQNTSNFKFISNGHRRLNNNRISNVSSRRRFRFAMCNDNKARNESIYCLCLWLL